MGKRKIDYCPNCDREVSFRTTVRKETFLIKSTEVEIESTVAVCPQCKQDLFHEPYEQMNIENAYKKYEQMTGERARQD